MTEYPFSVDQIVDWFRAQSAVRDSDVQVVEIRERTEYLPAAAADFDATVAMGRISGWVSGQVDFEVVRVSDGENIFWRHVDAGSVETWRCILGFSSQPPLLPRRPSQCMIDIGGHSALGDSRYPDM